MYLHKNLVLHVCQSMPAGLDDAKGESIPSEMPLDVDVGPMSQNRELQGVRPKIWLIPPYQIHHFNSKWKKVSAFVAAGGTEVCFYHTSDLTQKHRRHGLCQTALQDGCPATKASWPA